MHHLLAHAAVSLPQARTWDHMETSHMANDGWQEYRSMFRSMFGMPLLLLPSLDGGTNTLSPLILVSAWSSLSSLSDNSTAGNKCELSSSSRALPTNSIAAVLNLEMLDSMCSLLWLMLTNCVSVGCGPINLICITRVICASSMWSPSAIQLMEPCILLFFFPWLERSSSSTPFTVGTAIGWIDAQWYM